MATSAAQLSQFAGSSAGQYQPYPYNSGATYSSATYNSVSGATYNGVGGATYTDQYSAASLPHGQVQNFLRSPPGGGGRRDQQGLRYGDRTGGGRRRKQRGPVVSRFDGTPVVPLYSYPTVRNGTVVQVPLFWTALSIALGYEVHGDDVIRGLPCIKRLYQLFCRNAGSQYPTDRIESFINENKALTRRMFGEFQPPGDLSQEVPLFPNIQLFETVDFPESLRPADSAVRWASEANRVTSEATAVASEAEQESESTASPATTDHQPVAPVEMVEATGRDQESLAETLVETTTMAPELDTIVEMVLEPPPDFVGTEASSERGQASAEAGSRLTGDKEVAVSTTNAMHAQPAPVTDAVPLAEMAADLERINTAPNQSQAITDATATTPTEDDIDSMDDVESADDTWEIENQIANLMRAHEPEATPATHVSTSRPPTHTATPLRLPHASRIRTLPRTSLFIRRNKTPAGTSRGPADKADPQPTKRRPLRASRPARPRRPFLTKIPPTTRPAANRLPPVRAPAAARPMGGAGGAAAPMSAVRRVRGAGCGIMVPSVVAPGKYQYPMPAAHRAVQQPREQPLGRTRRAVKHGGRGSNGNSISNSTGTEPAPPPHRERRQAVSAPPIIDKGSKHLVDSCESKVEIITPYWAANSAGEIRAIVNTKHFPQAIHQEICKGTSTSRCTGNCLCEQKYTYHRLLSYDPDNDCKGIFIDWFLFPSCCACRCPP